VLAGVRGFAGFLTSRTWLLRGASASYFRMVTGVSTGTRL
jgi:hypothetical protein